MLLPVGCGRCYCHFITSLSVLLADGIAKMSLVFCNHQCWYIIWQMLLPSGRWNSHYRLHRAKTICSDPQLLEQEEDHLYKALSTCKYPAWASIELRWKWEIQPSEGTITTKRSLKLTPTRNLTSLFHTIEGSVKVSRKLVATMGCRCTSNEVQQWKTSWWLQRIKILWRAEVESSTDLNATGWSVMMNT